MNSQDEGPSTSIGQSRQRVGNLFPLWFSNAIPSEEDLLVLQTTVFTETNLSNEISVGHQLRSSPEMIRR